MNKTDDLLIYDRANISWLRCQKDFSELDFPLLDSLLFAASP